MLSQESMGAHQRLTPLRGRFLTPQYFYFSEIPPLLAGRTFLASGEAEKLYKGLVMVTQIKCSFFLEELNYLTFHTGPLIAQRSDDPDNILLAALCNHYYV